MREELQIEQNHWPALGGSLIITNKQIIGT